MPLPGMPGAGAGGGMGGIGGMGGMIAPMLKPIAQEAWVAGRDGIPFDEWWDTYMTNLSGGMPAPGTLDQIKKLGFSGESKKTQRH